MKGDERPCAENFPHGKGRAANQNCFSVTAGVVQEAPSANCRWDHVPRAAPRALSMVLASAGRDPSCQPTIPASVSTLTMVLEKPASEPTTTNGAPHGNRRCEPGAPQPPETDLKSPYPVRARAFLLTDSCVLSFSNDGHRRNPATGGSRRS
jgi:hypothetical protein